MDKPSALRSCLFFGSRRYPPNRVAYVVGDEQRARSIHGDADRAAPGLALSANEAGEHIFRFAGGTAIGEGYENPLITAARRAVPCPVLADERAAGVVIGQ